MDNNSGFIKKALSLITYKKPKDVKEFYIPEVNKKGNEPKSEDTGKSAKTNSGNTQKEKKDKGTKKPVLVNYLLKQQNGNQLNADDSIVSSDIDSNKSYLEQKFSYPTNKDIIIREFTVASKYKAFIAYLDGMVDRITINNFILRPLLIPEKLNDENSECQLDFILQSVIETNQAKKVTDPDEAI